VDPAELTANCDYKQTPNPVLKQAGRPGMESFKLVRALPTLVIYPIGQRKQACSVQVLKASIQKRRLPCRNIAHMNEAPPGDKHVCLLPSRLRLTKEGRGQGKPTVSNKK